MSDKEKENKDGVPENDDIEEGQDGTDEESDADQGDDESEGDDIDVDLDDEEDESDGEEDDADDSDDADEGEDDAEASDEDGEDDSEADEGEEESGKKLSAIAQKKKWRKRALEAEAKLREKGNAKKPSGKANNKQNESRRDNSVLINFRLDHPTLKSQEVAEIEAYAKARGVSLERAFKSDVIRIMIARNRKKQQQQGGSISPSRRGQPTKPEKDWSRAGRDEMEKEAARRRAASRQAKR